MINQEETKYQYRAGIGCYGATRGTTLALIAKERVKQLTEGRMGVEELEIIVEGFGSQKEDFMPSKKIDHPVKDENIAAIAYWQNKLEEIGISPLNFENIINTLRITGRKKVTREQLQSADIIFGIDAFVTGEYARYGCDNGTGSSKYQTVIQGTNLLHARYGLDLDDTEASTDFVQRVVIPSIKGGKPIGDTDPRNAKYYDLSGREYIAGSQEAMLASARDLLYLGSRLGERILTEAKIKAKNLSKKLRGNENDSI